MSLFTQNFGNTFCVICACVCVWVLAVTENYFPARVDRKSIRVAHFRPGRCKGNFDLPGQTRNLKPQPSIRMSSRAHFGCLRSLTRLNFPFSIHTWTLGNHTITNTKQLSATDTKSKLLLSQLRIAQVPQFRAIGLEGCVYTKLRHRFFD